MSPWWKVFQLSLQNIVWNRRDVSQGMTHLAGVGALYELAGCDDDHSPSSGDEEQRNAVTHRNHMNSPATNSLIVSRVCLWSYCILLLCPRAYRAYRFKRSCNLLWRDNNTEGHTNINHIRSIKHLAIGGWLVVITVVLITFVRIILLLSLSPLHPSNTRTAISFSQLLSPHFR